MAHLLECCFWVQVGGADPIALLKKYAGRVRHVHLKDMACGEGATSTGVGRIMTPVFEGNMNYAGFIDACYEAGVENLIVEQDRPDAGNTELSAVRKSIEYLRSLN